MPTASECVISDVAADDGQRLLVLLSGRGSNFQAIQGAIEARLLNGRIAAVVSDSPQAGGLQLAADAGLDTLSIDRKRFPDRAAFEDSLATAIDGFRPHYIVLAGFMRVLGSEFVDRYAGRLINIHPSLLPRHRGLNTHQRVLDAGEREHGASVHFVTPALDAGPVISQVELQVNDRDTADDLADRLLPLEHRLYPATLALLLSHRVELRHECIFLDDQPLDRPLVLGRDLGPDGRLLEPRDGG